MSYSEHKRMKPVIDAARELDIATNPAPEALFEAGNSGFQIWCTPDDQPEGWKNVHLIAGAFSKPCAYVASVTWGWEKDNITHLILSTDAYELSEYTNFNNRYQKHNRPEDINWAKKKIRELFSMANVPLLPFRVTTNQKHPEPNKWR
ncbi:MAG: hypothetical protein DRI56_09685 [Chloroflexota bacterium]|nr:MAG: hypothetical protein DRI56_09685 [Chloroflexota bacterium]